MADSVKPLSPDRAAGVIRGALREQWLSESGAMHEPFRHNRPNGSLIQSGSASNSLYRSFFQIGALCVSSAQIFLQ